MVVLVIITTWKIQQVYKVGVIARLQYATVACISTHVILTKGGIALKKLINNVYFESIGVL